MRLVFVNGKLVPQNEATVNVYDHGLLYGDGVFEGIRVYNGKVFRNREHILRLYESARAIRLKIPMPVEQMIAAVEMTVNENDAIAAPHDKVGYIRLVVTRGAGTLGLDPGRTSNPQVIIIADSISLYPPETYTNGMKLVTASTIRNHTAALSPRIKSLNYLNNIMAKLEGLDAGCQEALMLNHKGEVAECTGDNLFIVKDGTLKTPPTDAGILEGITRNAVIELARKANIGVMECALIRHDIYVADECFLTGTAAEVVPVTSLDNRPIGDGKPGPITQKLIGLFKSLVNQ